MTKTNIGNWVVSLWLFSAVLAAETLPTPNLSRTLDLQTHYANALKGEQVIELTTDNERFIALTLQQRTATPQGTVLILHDLGQSPDWPYLLQQTREYLPDVGWNTLAIALPTPRRDAIGILPLTSEETTTTLSPEPDDDGSARVLARIQSGIRHINSNNVFNIVVLGYGDGGYWGARYLAERLSPQEENGYALILFDAPPDEPSMPDYIGQLQIPTLDLYMNDSEFAHYQARLRKGAAQRAQHPDYLQIHDALRQQAYGKPDIDRSTRRVWGWLRNHAAGQEAQLSTKTNF